MKDEAIIMPAQGGSWIININKATTAGCENKEMKTLFNMAFTYSCGIVKKKIYIYIQP